MKRREFLVGAASLGLAATTQSFAQDPSGSGALPGGANDYVLPGPWGFLGNPGGSRHGKGKDGEEKPADKAGAAEGGDFLKDLGTLEMGAGGLLMSGGGLIASTGVETGGAGFILGGSIGVGGAIMGAAGLFAFGAGMALEAIADDPPRPRYQRDPSCNPVLSRDILLLQALPARGRGLVDASYRLYASVTNTLASLELHGGARLAGDAAWQRRHRANFMRYWHEMRQDLLNYGATTESLSTHFAELQRSEGISTKALFANYQKNRVATDKTIRGFYTELLAAYERAGCGEVAHARRAVSMPHISRRSLTLPTWTQRASQKTKRLVKGLPTYR